MKRLQFSLVSFSSSLLSLYFSKNSFLIRFESCSSFSCNSLFLYCRLVDVVVKWGEEACYNLFIKIGFLMGLSFGAMMFKMFLSPSPPTPNMRQDNQRGLELANFCFLRWGKALVKYFLLESSSFLRRMLWIYFKMDTFLHLLPETGGNFSALPLELGRVPRGKTQENVGSQSVSHSEASALSASNNSSKLSFKCSH